MSPSQLLRQILFSRLRFRILILLSSFLASFFGLLGPFLQKEYFDLLARGNTDLWYVMAAFVCILLYLGLSQLTLFLGQREAILMQGELSQKMYSQSLRLRSDSLQGKPVGEFVSVYATDIPGATVLLEQTLPTGASILFPLILAPWALHQYFAVPWLPLLSMMAAVSLLNFAMAYRQSSFFFQFKKLAADRIGLVNEWIQNIRSLRILGWMSAFELKIFEMRKRETENRIGMLTNGQSMNSVASSITFVLNIVVILSLTASLPGPVSPGQLLAVLWIVGVFLTRPFRQMPWLFTFLFDAWTSIKRLSDILQMNNLEAQNRKLEFQKIADLDADQPALKVQNLNLSIDGSEILKSINFEIQKGEFVAIVGEVGCGKTMLLLSLMGETGASFQQLKLGSNDGKSIPLHQLRQFFTFVPQEGFIMSASLRENVAFEYGQDSSADEQIRQALKNAQFDLTTERLEHGLDTEIGERGVNLSGGQKQRVSLARVDFLSSPILLLDDCLSALDVDTEDKIILDLFEGSWKNKTRLLVTHRLSVLDQVHRILFMENGKIIDQGSLDDLLLRNPKFQQFCASIQKKSTSENEIPIETENVTLVDETLQNSKGDSDGQF